MNAMQPILVQADREKLQQWKLSNKQIAAVEQSGKIRTVFDVIATVSGVVINKRVNQGDYIQQGQSLYEVADLSTVWVLFDAYESDLPWVKKGGDVSFSTQSHLGEHYNQKITFVDPVINPVTRVAQVRIEVMNRTNLLKPDMFVTGVLSSLLPSNDPNIIVPQSAVLWTGERSVVYVRRKGAKEPEFSMREVVLGPSLNNNYVILKGLNEGEEIVTNGTYSVDAAAQLNGKPSMMSDR